MGLVDPEQKQNNMNMGPVDPGRNKNNNHGCDPGLNPVESLGVIQLRRALVLFQIWPIASISRILSCVQLLVITIITTNNKNNTYKWVREETPK